MGNSILASWINSSWLFSISRLKKKQSVSWNLKFTNASIPNLSLPTRITNYFYDIQTRIIVVAIIIIIIYRSAFWPCVASTLNKTLYTSTTCDLWNQSPTTSNPSIFLYLLLTTLPKPSTTDTSLPNYHHIFSLHTQVSSARHASQ